MATKMHKYLITSERANRRNDERDNLLRSSNVYTVGQIIILDGLKWTVTKVLEQGTEMCPLFYYNRNMPGERKKRIFSVRQ